MDDDGNGMVPIGTVNLIEEGLPTTPKTGDRWRLSTDLSHWKNSTIFIFSIDERKRASYLKIIGGDKPPPSFGTVVWHRRYWSKRPAANEAALGARDFSWSCSAPKAAGESMSYRACSWSGSRGYFSYKKGEEIPAADHKHEFLA